jgi:hypothetical protein
MTEEEGMSLWRQRQNESLRAEAEKKEVIKSLVELEDEDKATAAPVAVATNSHIVLDNQYDTGGGR